MKLDDSQSRVSFEPESCNLVEPTSLAPVRPPMDR